MIGAFKKILTGTLFSRITGMFRDMALAMVFGASLELAAFFLAFRIALLFRRVLGESLVASIFIPEFSRLELQDPKEAEKFYWSAFFSLCTLSVAVCLFFECALFFVESPPGSVISQIKVLLVALVFISLYSVNQSFLQCRGSFFRGALAPVFLNLCLGVFCLFYSFFPDRSLGNTLSFVTIFGFFLQWLATQLSIRAPLRSFSLFSSEVKKLFWPAFLGALSISAMQINCLVDAAFSKAIDPLGPVYLWFAMRLEQVPVGLFAIALSSVYFPKLASEKRQKDYERSFEEALRYGILLMIFSTFGLLFFGKEAISVIFQRGAFLESSVNKTYLCLASYSLGLIPAFCIFLSQNVFYTKKSYKTPLKITISCVLLNGLFNSVFFLLGFPVFGVALATALSQWMQATFFIHFSKTAHLVFSPSFRKYFLQLVFAGIASGVLSSLGLDYFKTKELLGQTANFILRSGVYGVGFYGINRALWIKELDKLFLSRVSDEFAN